MAPITAQKKDQANYRWLKEEEQETWLKVIAATMLTAPLLETDLQKAGSVSFFEYQVLSTLKEAEGALTMSELAGRCNSSLSRLSHVARKLEERGAIVRTPAVNDKRVTMAELTQQGQRDVDRVVGRYTESVRKRVLDALTEEEVQSLASLADTLLSHLDPEHWLFTKDQEDDYDY